MDAVFRALADPTRRSLLDELFKHDGQSLTELEERLPMTRFGVMKHLKVLEQAGLVTTKRRGREKLHFLNPVPIRLVHDRWVSKYAEPWAAGLSGLKRALEEAMMEKVFEMPRRRQILDLLAGGERPVNDLVARLGLAQPQVSKHLRVLREVGVVDVRDAGRQRLYRLNGPALKPIHDWVSNYERLWSERFDQLDVVLEDLKAKEQGDGNGGA